MDVEFAKLPKIFSRTIIMGEIREAVCMAENGEEFIIVLHEDAQTIKDIKKAMPLDNVDMTIELAIGPAILIDASRENVLEALRHRSHIHTPLTFLSIAMEKTLDEETRLDALEVAKEFWSEDAAAFTRSRFLSGDKLSKNSDVENTIELCRVHNFHEFIPIFEELGEAMPHIERAGHTFRPAFIIAPEIGNKLLDQGILAEAALGLARNDFSRLDRLVERLSNDEDLTSARYPLESFARRIRGLALGRMAEMPSAHNRIL